VIGAQQFIQGIGGAVNGLVVDLFAGAGGASLGIEMAIGRSPDVAVNHSPRAIRQHTINHPSTEHHQTDVWEVSPRAVAQGRPVSLLWASPDCRHFSRAKGKAPVSQRVRSLAWVVCRWAAEVAPAVIHLENVPEFLTWGPLLPDGRPCPERAGQTFHRFVARLRSLGYASEWRELCAADYGVPTIRRRLFLTARRDEQPIRWPAPTHGRDAWRPALDCLDLSIPVPSILTRDRPLAAATLGRFAAGLRRFAIEASDPVLIRVPRSDGTQALAAAWLAKHYTGVVGTTLRVPLGTITAVDHHALCVAWLSSYYGSGGQWSDLRQPMPTVVGKARHALCTATIAGRQIVDLGMRMLTPRELARGQGFPDAYQIIGTTAEKIAGIGNSVCPPLAAALVRVNLVPAKTRRAVA
jgi:DNA (cytosine-5)-methyltransferase 1